MSQNGDALRFAFAELKDDREIVLAAVSQNGDALDSASSRLQNGGLSGLGIERIPISISAASSSTSLSSSSKIQKPINNLSSHNYTPGAKLNQKLEKFLTELSSEDIKEPANKKPRPSSN